MRNFVIGRGITYLIFFGPRIWSIKGIIVSSAFHNFIRVFKLYRKILNSIIVLFQKNFVLKFLNSIEKFWNTSNRPNINGTSSIKAYPIWTGISTFPILSLTRLSMYGTLPSPIPWTSLRFSISNSNPIVSPTEYGINVRSAPESRSMKIFTLRFKPIIVTGIMGFKISPSFCEYLFSNWKSIKQLNLYLRMGLYV